MSRDGVPQLLGCVRVRLLAPAGLEEPRLALKLAARCAAFFRAGVHPVIPRRRRSGPRGHPRPTVIEEGFVGFRVLLLAPAILGAPRCLICGAKSVPQKSTFKVLWGRGRVGRGWRGREGRRWTGAPAGVCELDGRRSGRGGGPRPREKKLSRTRGKHRNPLHKALILGVHLFLHNNVGANPWSAPRHTPVGTPHQRIVLGGDLAPSVAP